MRISIDFNLTVAYIDITNRILGIYLHIANVYEKY